MAAPLSIAVLLPACTALLAGAAVPFQAASNATLGRMLGHPLWATLVSLSVSLVLVFPALLALRVSAPAVATASQAPWWVWMGGLAGVAYVTAALVLTPRLGAANFIICVIAGQMISSLLIDHFGLMGLAQKPATIPRIAGVVLILAGMLVMQWASPAAEKPMATKASQPATAST